MCFKISIPTRGIQEIKNLEIFQKNIRKQFWKVKKLNFSSNAVINHKKKSNV